MRKFVLSIGSILLSGTALRGSPAVPEGPPDCPPLALPAEGESVPLPAWMPEASRVPDAVGRTNVVGLSAEWAFPPPYGRPPLLAVGLTNLTGQAHVVPRGDGFYAAGEDQAGAGLLCHAPAGSAVVALEGLPDGELVGSSDVLLAPGAAALRECILPAHFLVPAADAGSVVLRYVGTQGRLVYWAESTPLPVPAAAQAPGTAGTNEWIALLSYWQAMPAALRAWFRPGRMLETYPEFARFYSGVVIDAALPEAFRLSFAESMPPLDAYDPAVLAFVTNAVDKTAPLVIAALRVLRLSRGGTPEEGAARDAVGPLIYAMSQDAQLPLLFRLHAAHTFRMHIPIDEFNLRGEAHFKLLAANEIRGDVAGDYYEADRVLLRAGLTALLSDTTPFVAGPMAGRYPENATVGQVATIILADLEAKWAAEPARTD